MNSNKSRLRSYRGRALPSVWKQGAKASAVITFILVCGNASNLQADNGIEFWAEIQSLVINLIISFLILWLISAGLVWLWRIPRFGLIAILFAIGIIGYALYWSFDHLHENYNVAPPIPTPQSIAIASLTPTPNVLGNLLNPSATPASQCYSALSDLTPFIGKTICVTGIIVKRIPVTIDQDGNWGERYFFNNSMDSFFLQYDMSYTPDSPDDLVPRFAPILPELRTCIKVTGTLMLSGDQIPFMEYFDTVDC